MVKLERLIQDEAGALFSSDRRLRSIDYRLKGKITCLVVKNPCLDISKEIQDTAERASTFVPEGANSYVASEFNPDTQHIINESGKKYFYSVYAVQFYRMYK